MGSVMRRLKAGVIVVMFACGSKQREQDKFDASSTCRV